MHGDEDADGDDTLRLVRDIVSDLSILQHGSAEHPLLSPAAWRIREPNLESDAALLSNAVLVKAREYESQVQVAIASFDRGTSSPGADMEVRPLPETTENEPWQLGQRQQSAFDSVGAQFATLPAVESDSLGVIVLSALQPDVGDPTSSQSSSLHATQSAPDDMSVSAALRPYLSVQARLAGSSALRLLFGQGRLRAHLAAQYDHQLFGDSAFAHRLSNALFSASTSSAAELHHRGGGSVGNGTLGLRLDDRTSWPPGGAELRLSLMGVLAAPTHSFSVRELSDAEIVDVCTPASPAALDFLTLQSLVPSSLVAADVLAPRQLELYDAVFRALLCVRRTLHVAQQLRLRVLAGESHLAPLVSRVYPVVAAASDYLLGAAISVPRAEFTKSLDALERDGIGRVRDLVRLHDDFLSQVTRNTLVARGGATEALRAVFAVVLGVAREGVTVEEVGEAEKRFDEAARRLVETLRPGARDGGARSVLYESLVHLVSPSS